MSVNHAAMHDSRHETTTIVTHLQRDTHWLIGVLLELNQTHAGDLHICAYNVLVKLLT